MNVEEKREKEKNVVSKMIRIYCKGNKHSSDKDELCAKCKELEEYSRLRTDKCPFMETKTFCSKCKISCYKPIMKKQIREVMKYSGPRLLIYHPILTLEHFVLDRKKG